MEWHHQDFLLSDDKVLLQLAVVHGFLTDCYWSEGISEAQVAAAIRGSYCFGLYQGGEQLGFGRLVTDHATFAYLADVFVLPAHRGQGLAKWMLESIFSQDWAQGLRRIMLATRDAHGLYRQLGFNAPASPQLLMEVHRPGIYKLNPYN
ncbi:GNAT family N-acetyltransferase [Gallaecimonas kandeliae]|uniref:GNAT family N-acetyltransferase n=1 Tax=Gallaecimonas kandeliae TaxID=3029055 RepID=UPI002648C952|nr:GNAT family N-acetyltransferase [Gallaecimonas kandeliae]WKE65101.1 GNAT family N-acetyltransferase [Gallaecimonas kandeliae]